MIKKSFIFYVWLLLFFNNILFSQTIFPFDTVDVEETFFGKTVRDPFRNLEDLTTKNTISFLNSQEEKAEEYFNKSNVLKKYTKYIRKIDKEIVEELGKLKISESGAYFYEKTSSLNYRWKLYFRDSLNSDEQVLFDPQILRDTTTKRYEIRSFAPSWDATKVLIAIASKHSHTSEIILLDVQTGDIERTGIKNSRPEEYYGMNWLPNGDGFTFTSLKIIDPKNPEVKLNTSLSLYDFKTKTIRNIFGEGLTPKTDNRLFPVTHIKGNHDKYIIVYLGGPDTFWDSYYTTFKDLENPSPDWKPLRKKSHKVVYGIDQLIEDDYYYLTYKDNGQSSIAKLNLNDSNKKIGQVLETTDEIITNFISVADSLFITTSKHGVANFLYGFKDDKYKKIVLPMLSTEIDIRKGNNGSVWIGAKSPLKSVSNFLYKDGKVEQLNFYDSGTLTNFKNLIFKVVEVEGHDGEIIPMSIIHQKGLKLNGENAVFNDSYGAFGTMVDVSFQTQFLSFASLGGVLVRPHIRGGGAKGHKWHIAGKKQNKPNSWKDLISCMEYLINNRYTSSSKISVFSESGGAIPIAMLVNKRPDLVGALIIGSGVLNPYRKEAIYKSTGFAEYGTMKDSIEARGLIAMDPYLNIPKTTKFPSTLVLHGAKDDRIYLHEPLKYVMKMQQNNTGNNPILLDIDPNGTHNTVTSYYSYYGRVFSFALNETNQKVKF